MRVTRPTDEQLLLDLLNSTPVLDNGRGRDRLADPEAVRGWLGEHDRPATVQEALAVLAWDELRAESPGRLRACANPECRLFLIDHSKPNSARWCSMATCGNRMKARRHYRRSHDESADRHVG